MTLRPYLLVAAMALAAALRAETAVEITVAGGPVITFPFSEHPSISVADGVATVSSDKGSRTLAVADIDCWRFVEAAGIETVTTDSRVRFAVADGQLTAEGRPGAPIIITNEVGVVVAAHKADSHGRWSTALSALPAGVVIVAVDSQCIKFLNRR